MPAADSAATAGAPLIEVAGLVKEFRVFDRREGVKGAFLDLFRREYRTLRAVDGIDITIGRGETVGYLGPNGAGKSTTIKMLTGILVPTAGRLVVDGLVPHRDRKHYARKIGVVFGQRTQLWWELAVVESFRLLGKIYRVAADDVELRIAELSEILELSPLLRTPVRKLSLGQRMRCDLAASLIHMPPILFLDEPTIGLDMVAKDSVRAFLRAINQRYATTILLTTHDLRDIEELCRRVIVIDHGRKIFDGELGEMKRRHAGRSHVEVEVAKESSVSEIAAAAAGAAGGGAGARQIDVAHVGGNKYRCSFERDELRPADLIRALMASFDVVEVAIGEASIEEVVRRIYGGSSAAESNR
jgi:ABC-2 type transport system ATP-binding protein